MDKSIQDFEDPHYDVFPKSWCGHAFTDEERECLLSGKVVHLPDCRSRNGNCFVCNVYWGPTDGMPHWIQIHPIPETMRMIYWEVRSRA